MPRGVGVRVSSSSLSIAEIAQLVEHNLAKVGVASSSLVFRSMLAQVAELVDAHVSGACVERRAGSTPVLGTDSRGSVFKYRTSFYFTSHPAALPTLGGRKGKPRIILDEIP